MRTVYKYLLSPQPTTLRNLLAPSVNHVGLDPQTGEVAVWVDHYAKNPPRVSFAPVDMTLHVIGTGREVPQGSSHVGSVVAHPFVWHVYATTRRVPLAKANPQATATEVDQ